MFLLAASAGMFVASTGISSLCLTPILTSLAYLPSTFAMYGITLSHAFALKPSSQERTIHVFATVGVVSLISWPFALALAFPLAIHDLIEPPLNKANLWRLFEDMLRAAITILLSLVLQS